MTADPADIVREELRTAQWSPLMDTEIRGGANAALDAIESELKGLRVLASLVSGVLCDAGTIPVAACDDVEGLHRGLRELLAERDALRIGLHDMGIEGSVCCSCGTVMQAVRPGRVQCFGCEMVADAEQERDTATNRAEAAEARVADYENSISWFTSCANCAKLMDKNYAAYVRADAAEAEAAKLRGLLASTLGLLNDLDAGYDNGETSRQTQVLIEQIDVALADEGRQG